MRFPLLLLSAVFTTAGASLHAQPLNAAAAKDFAEYQLFSPQKTFYVAGDGSTNWWAGSSGETPETAIASGRKRCEDRGKTDCRLHALNNIMLAGRDWKTALPPALPAIGRLRVQPWWENKGPQAAAGLIVWSHGYMEGKDATAGAPQPYVGRFTAAGYDLYRFDREYIRDWPGDATALADAVRQAKAMGYRRVILAGQSAGAWVSMAATLRGAPVDGVISIAAAHHGYVGRMTDPTRARSDWQQVVRGIKPGPRLVVVNFAKDDYDVGGRMDDASAAFSANRVDAEVISDPAGFSGHGAGNDFAFARKYGACMQAFIETGARQPPCS